MVAKAFLSISWKPTDALFLILRLMDKAKEKFHLTLLPACPMTPWLKLHALAQITILARMDATLLSHGVKRPSQVFLITTMVDSLPIQDGVGKISLFLEKSNNANCGPVLFQTMWIREHTLDGLTSIILMARKWKFPTHYSALMSLEELMCMVVILKCRLLRLHYTPIHKIRTERLLPIPTKPLELSMS